MTETTSDNTPAATSRRPGRFHAATRRGLALFAAGLLAGALIVLAIRFITFSHNEEHYHANFAVYIDGQREQFKDPQYYQEVKICDLGGNSPLARTHMHDKENGVVHVHDAAVTWGQFFENLGWIVGPDFIRTTDKLYVADGTNKLNIRLNGQDLTDVTTITNQVIGDKDRLLVSYGPADTALLDSQYKTVPDTAGAYDSRNDPASCGSSGTPTIKERFQNLL